MTTDTDGKVETCGGALRLLVIASDIVAGRCWADSAPKDPTFPYTTFIDGIVTVPALKGDAGTLMLERTLQLDLWEKIRDEDQRVVRAVYAAVNGIRAQVGDGYVRFTVTDTQRLIEEANSIVHRALTITARHDPTAL